MRFALAVVLSSLVLSSAPQAAEPAPPIKIADGLVNPESVCVGVDGRMYVTTIGEFDKPGDGGIVAMVPGKTQTFVTGLDDPKGIDYFNRAFYVADQKRVLRVDMAGKVEVFAAAEAFPRSPLFLNDVEVDAKGNVYVTDTGDLQGAGGGVFRIDPKGKVTTIIDAKTTPELKGPNGLLVDGAGHLLLFDFIAGKLHRVDLEDNSLATLAENLPGGDGIARDYDGNIYLSQWKTGEVTVLRRGSKQVELLSTKFQQAADICINYKTGHVIVPDMKAGTVSTLPLVSPRPTDVDETPLPVEIAQVWPNVEIARPIVLTHANDGSGRRFCASQLGQVYILPKNDDDSQATLFFDLHESVSYKNSENEEGFLGMAFHPKFKENGQFFVYYTSTESPHLSKISRFRVDADNPNHASVKSEEVLMRIPQPYWNHNGGTLAFGPDGFLYIALGDGGSANDPQNNAQNLSTWLGSILRIDVDRKEGKLAYGIPQDNPFLPGGSQAGRADGAKPETYAYGVRNIWRMSFDRQTGEGWFADVGQDIWEEINLLKPGANYGWALRESMHRFRETGSGPRRDLTEPIWEYHHDVGKSVTGGHVYRGPIQALQGHYIYADYVTGRVWGLKYDKQAKRVVANRPIAGNTAPVMSFGEDQDGEVYFMTPEGRLYRFRAPRG
ncbi:MAG: PQQ-dependent sugar dehydrogenase [Planctomycetes bacterium]|nr:PQQ-dependent sugar dehydrogenase [Planctomycetota bacterium]